MRKQVSFVLAMVLLAGSVVGCSTKEEVVATTQEEATTLEQTTQESSKEELEGGMKLGMSVITSLASSKGAGEKDGNAQVDAVGVAVLVDEEGKIVDCIIDTAQNKMGFSAQGTIIPKEAFSTKKELKDEYGMKAASAIGKEWYEQAEALEAYVVGKTVSEVKGIAVDESEKPTDVDLAASCSMKIGTYKDAIVEAMGSAQSLGSNEGDQLGFGVVTDMLHASKDAGEKDGVAQSDSTFAAVTVDGDGKVTAALVDCVQGKVAFDTAGVITSDLTTSVKTKGQLGADYNMKSASPIGKEWNEQVAGFTAFVNGKTAQEIEGIAVNEETKPTDVDLAASCTMSIGDLQKSVVKAMSRVK